MLKYTTIGFILFGMLLLSCRYNKSSKDLIDEFYKNETELNSIIQQVQSDKHLDSLFLFCEPKHLPEIKNSYPKIYHKLQSLGIKHVSAHHKVSPGKTYWYYFETEWPNEYLICLFYNADNSSESRKGYYNMDEVKNETWGLGNKWTMFRWVKDKYYKQ